MLKGETSDKDVVGIYILNFNILNLFGVINKMKCVLLRPNLLSSNLFLSLKKSSILEINLFKIL